MPRDLDALDVSIADPRDVLRFTAGAGGRVRAAQAAALSAGLAQPSDRPRSLVVCGPDAAVTAAAIRALGGPACPVPVLHHEGPGLPGFVGPLDMIAVCGGWNLDLAPAASADEAGRRGARLIAVGPEDSPVIAAAARARGEHLELPRGPVDWWSLVIPIVIAASAAGILTVTGADIAATADRLDAVAITCRPDADIFSNPAKSMGSALSEGTPVLWGASETVAAAARQGVSALTALAGIIGVGGALPEPGDAAFGVLMSRASLSSGDELEDLFRDRADEPDDDRPGPVVVILRDTDEDQATATRADVVARVAGEQHHPVHRLAAAGESRLERLASVAGLLTLAAVYAALATGREPGSPAVSDDIGAWLRG